MEVNMWRFVTIKKVWARTRECVCPLTLVLVIWWAAGSSLPTAPRWPVIMHGSVEITVQHREIAKDRNRESENSSIIVQMRKKKKVGTKWTENAKYAGVKEIERGWWSNINRRWTCTQNPTNTSICTDYCFDLFIFLASLQNTCIQNYKLRFHMLHHV